MNLVSAFARTEAAPDLLRAAFDYVARGWPVLPLKPGGKEPLGRLVRNGHRGATTDPEQIRRWWTAEPSANVGVVCGPSSFDVLDVDGPEGMATLRDLVKLNGRLVTRMHRTPRGWHLLFKPGGLPTSAGKVGRGLDTRGSGAGQIVMPPSRNGQGAVYREAVRAELAEAPAWLVELARGPKPTSRSLGESVARVREAPKGQRNTTLACEVFIAAKKIARETTKKLVRVSSLPRPEAEQTGRKVERAGLAAGVAAELADLQRYHVLTHALMGDPMFKKLSAEAKLVSMFIHASPAHALPVPGVACVTVSELAAETSLAAKDVQRALKELSRRRLLRRDAARDLLWMPVSVRAYPPSKDSVARYWSKKLNEAPACALRDEIRVTLAAGPFGEVFTRPLVRDTRGRLHVAETAP